MRKIKTIFMGTPDFSIPTLEILANHPHIQLEHIITMPSRKSGRGQKLSPPPIAKYCLENNLPFTQTVSINREEALLERFQKEQAHLIIVLAFSQFLSQKVLEIPRIGAFNIHTSLLPKYRGAAPIQYALLNGDTETGVSIQKMVKKMDAGDIVLSEPIKIRRDETGGELYTRLKYQAALSCHDFIDLILNEKLDYQKQDESLASFAPTLKKEDGFLNFKNESADSLINRVRALKPWPGTYCYLGKETLKIIEIEKTSEKLPPGTVKASKNSLIIGTVTQGVSLRKVQIPGKKPFHIKDFLNGFKKEVMINP